MSANNYVAARMKAPDVPYKTEASVDQIKVSVPARCDHCRTVCSTEECMAGWEIDWIMYWERTAAGRKLREATSTQRQH